MFLENINLDELAVKVACDQVATVPADEQFGVLKRKIISGHFVPEIKQAVIEAIKKMGQVEFEARQSLMQQEALSELSQMNRVEARAASDLLLDEQLRSRDEDAIKALTTKEDALLALNSTSQSVLLPELKKGLDTHNTNKEKKEIVEKKTIELRTVRQEKDVKSVQAYLEQAMPSEKLNTLQTRIQQEMNDLGKRVKALSEKISTLKGQPLVLALLAEESAFLAKNLPVKKAIRQINTQKILYEARQWISNEQKKVLEDELNAKTVRGRVIDQLRNAVTAGQALATIPPDDLSVIKDLHYGARNTAYDEGRRRLSTACTQKEASKRSNAWRALGLAIPTGLSIGLSGLQVIPSAYIMTMSLLTGGLGIGTLCCIALTLKYYYALKGLKNALTKHRADFLTELESDKKQCEEAQHTSEIALAKLEQELKTEWDKVEAIVPELGPIPQELREQNALAI